MIITCSHFIHQIEWCVCITVVYYKDKGKTMLFAF